MEKSIVEQIEDAILARIKPMEAMPKLEIDLVPELESGFSAPFEFAKISICYNGSKFDPTATGMQMPGISTDNAVQQETIHFKLSIQSQVLRGENGIYPLIQMLRKKLVGFEPAGADPLKLIDIGYKDLKENIWTYEMMVGTRGVSIPDLDQVDEPNISEVNYDELFPTELPTE